MKYIVRIFLLLLIVGIAAYNYIPAVRIATFRVIGRSPGCSLEEALKAPENLRLQIKYRDDITNASKLLQSDPKGFHQWQTPRGTYWVPDGSDYALPFNLGEQQRQIYGTGEQAVKSGDIVLDCGASVGVFTRVALDNGAGKVIAIEPAPENVECLRRTFAPEIAAGRVIVYPKGVWDKEDTLPMNINPKNSASDSFVLHPKEAVSTQQLALTTIDHLVNELKLDRVDFIKMDIEGSELRALAGAAATLTKWKPRISVASFNQEDHPAKIPPLILSTRPDYKMFCGPCAEGDHAIHPDVLYFR